MITLKKALVLFLALPFLYEGNAAMAHGSKDFKLNERTFIRRTPAGITLQSGKSTIKARQFHFGKGIRPTARAIAPMNRRFSMSHFLTTKQRPQRWTRPIVPMRRKVTAQNFFSQGFRPATRTTSAIIQPRTDFSAIRNGRRTPVKDPFASNQQILIKASDLPPGLTTMYYSATRAELVGIVHKLKTLEDAQQLLPGTTQSLRDTLRRKYRVVL